MIIATLRMSVRPEEREGFLKTIQSIVELVRVEPGCISYDIYQDIKDENSFILVEEWEKKTDFDNHVRKENYRRLIALMGRLSMPPQIRINTVTESAGIEYIGNILL
jgi:quinol monooxygenase YgiN